MACIYKLKVGEQEITFDSEKALVDYIKANRLYETLVPRKATAEHKTADLAAVLRQVAFGENNFSPSELRKFQTELLDKFIEVEKQADQMFKMGAAIALTKGLGKDLGTIDKVKKNLYELGVEMPEDEWNRNDLGIPFDVRYLLTGDSKYAPVGDPNAYHHEITANNVRTAKEVDALARTMFLERTPQFDRMLSSQVKGLRDNLSPATVQDIKDELSAYSQIAAYKQWIAIHDKKTTTLRNSLIYDTTVTTPTIVDIVKEAQERAPNNTFLQFILPVSTIVKIGARNILNVNNRDLINTIEGKTRGKIEPDLVASMMDSFTELYNNPETKFHAKALFDYLIVKDAAMFKHRSFIKMIPTLMFKEMSDATGLATKLMAATSDSEYKNILKQLNGMNVIEPVFGYQMNFFTAIEFNRLKQGRVSLTQAETADLITRANADAAARKAEVNQAFRDRDYIRVKQFLYKTIFNYSDRELYSQFEHIYGTDVRNQRDLITVRESVNVGGKKQAVDNLTFSATEQGSFMRVNLFSPSYRALSEEDRAKGAFKAMLDRLGLAGFNVSPFSIRGQGDDNRTYLEFKRFVRRRLDEKTFVTYELQRVRLDNQWYSGANMIPEGELIARGVEAEYKMVEVVGAANTTGAADLGPRPTKDQMRKAIAEKIARRGGGQTPGAAPTGGTTPPVGGGSPTAGGPTSAGGGTTVRPSGAARQYTPDNITKASDIDGDFVFGSNTQGRHGKGAALTARTVFGATYGQSEGKQGRSYAIVTKDLTKTPSEKSIPLEQIGRGIQNALLYYKNTEPNTKAYFVRLGASLAGYTIEEIKGLFKAIYKARPDLFTDNIILPKEYEVRDEQTSPAASQPSEGDIQMGGSFLGTNLGGGPIQQFSQGDMDNASC
jgi:hypothetical protein